MKTGMLKKAVNGIYHGLQRHYISFRILVWLKEQGVTRKINFLINHFNDRKMSVFPTEEMDSSKELYKENKERILNMFQMLSDEKSKTVWGGVMDYRIKRRPIPRGLYSEKDQYFCRDIIRLEDGEVFVDGGAYTGDTIQQFLDTCKREKICFKRIIAFEPDKKNFRLLSKFYGKKKKIILINKGLSREKGTLCFQEKGVNSRLEELGEHKVSVINIDVLPECRDATFIKMDIEGAEMDALYGAKETIRRNRPKLAICIYHSDEDMIRIAEYIHHLVPEYQLYIRHHSRSNVETVVYAVLE